MTHDEMIAVIQAHKEGKIIQSRDNRHIYGDRECDWINTEKPSWNFSQFEYRIVPIQFHHRPFRNAEEVMAAIKEHGFIVRNCTHDEFQVTFNSENIALIDVYNDALVYGLGENAMGIFTFKDGTPFGIKEEKQK